MAKASARQEQEQVQVELTDLASDWRRFLVTQYWIAIPPNYTKEYFKRKILVPKRAYGFCISPGTQVMMGW